MHLFLQFSRTQGPRERARLGYSFLLFCAVYGHEAVDDSGSAHALLSYESHHSNVTKPVLSLTRNYRARSSRVSAPGPTRFREGDECTVLFYAPENDCSPDWLAEIFEWVSCADEYSVTARDSIGRIPFHASYVGRYGLDALRPYAAVAMFLLQRALCKLVPAASEQPVPPSPASRHCIVTTHDVDFLPLSRFDHCARLAKNAVISLVAYRSRRLAFSQIKQVARSFAAAEHTFDQLSPLVAGERKRNVDASYYFIPSRLHRRDASYSVDNAAIVTAIKALVANGVEIGVHGSYTSLDRPGQLSSEFRHLNRLGLNPSGGRQHWLRFDLSRLVREVERAGAAYDASIGWADSAGFRAGACFPFTPYNFETERAANFLEFPLVIMDQHLQKVTADNDARFITAANILAASRRYGWGGISVLWHPSAFDGYQLDPDIGQLYWRLLDSSDHTWTSASSLLSAIKSRFRTAGLLARQGRQISCEQIAS